MSWIIKKQIQEERAKLIEDAGKLLTVAFNEKRDMTSDESETWTRLHAEADKLTERAEKINLQEKAEKSIEQRIGREEFETSVTASTPNADLGKRAFQKFIRCGLLEMDANERRAMRDIALVPTDGMEKRTNALTSGGSGAGAEFVPQSFYDEFYQKTKYFGGVREAGATVIPTSDGRILPVPVMDDTSNTGELLTENSAATVGTDPSTAHLILNGYIFSSKVVLVSVSLLQDSAFPVEPILTDAFSVRIGRAQNTYYTTGSGSGQPGGVITGTTNVVTAAGSTAITYDDVLSVLYAPDRSYIDTDYRLMFSQPILVALKKLTDNYGRPLWNAGNVAAGTPATFDGYQYVINNDMDQTIATGKKTILAGNFKRGYVIRDVNGISMQRFNELYMASNLCVGFLAWTRHDGGVRDANAFAVLQH